MSITTHAPVRARRKALGAVAALALAAGALTASAGSADAAVTGSTSNASLTWGFSTYAASWGVATTGDVAAVNPSTKTGPGGSYTGSDGITLSDGTGTIAADGTGEIDFSGSVTYSPFAGYGSLVPDKSTVTLADFELDVTSATRGTLTAAVTYHKPTIDLTTPTRVTVASFDISSLSTDDGTFSLQSAAPDWKDVVPAGTYSGTYTDSWPTPLVDLLRPAVNSQDIAVYFYRTGTTTGNDNKAPLPLSVTADLATPSVTTEVTASNPTDGVTVSVSGDGFSATTNPGDAGVYVGLAPSGGLPDVSTQEGMSAFAASGWIQPSQLADGTFTTSLTAAADELDSSKTYSVYTWRAHTHSTTSQDTETPVEIDFASLDAKAGLELSGLPTSVKYGAARSVKVTASGNNGTPTGTVTAKISGTTVGTGTLKNGVATIALSKTINPGARPLTVSYASTNGYPATSASDTLNVVKAPVTWTWKTSTKPTSKKTGKGTATIASSTGSSIPTGVVKVTFTKGSSSKAVGKKLVGGKGTITVPKLAKGSWKVYVQYLGDTHYTSTVSGYRGTIVVTK